jgi:hypothetical protein
MSFEICYLKKLQKEAVKNEQWDSCVRGKEKFPPSPAARSDANGTGGEFA